MGEGKNGGKKGKGRQRSCIKDPWTKPKGDSIEGGVGQGRGKQGGKMETTIFEQQ